MAAFACGPGGGGPKISLEGIFWSHPSQRGPPKSRLVQNIFISIAHSCVNPDWGLRGVVEAAGGVGLYDVELPEDHLVGPRAAGPCILLHFVCHPQLDDCSFP